MKDHDLHTAAHWSQVLSAVGFFLLGLAAIVFVIWVMTASVKATAFDADYVRCYSKALVSECIKVANP